MHPGQHRRQRHEEAERTGEPIDVNRHGVKIATLRKGAEQGTRRVRPWVISMVDGSQVAGTYFRVGEAESAAINRAKRAEAEAAAA